MLHLLTSARRAVPGAALSLLASLASVRAGVTLSPLAGFGGPDGWLAPGENPYLTTGNTERGLAYCPVHDRVVLVSRSGGINIRLLDPASAEDMTGLDVGTGIIDTGSSGGTFKVSAVACDDEGGIYVANLISAAGTRIKIYHWADPSSAPVLYADVDPAGVFTGTPRFGDTFDLFQDGTVRHLVLGGGNTSGFNTPGYAVISKDGETLTNTFVTAFNPAGPAAGDFRLGATFLGAADAVWGRQNTGTSARRTLYTAGSATGTYSGTAPLTATSEVGMDYIELGGSKLLATCEFNNSTTAVPRVRIYDVGTPGAPQLVANGTTAVGPFTANSNGVGSIKWGKVTTGDTATTATLYAMSTNQGIQAFTVTVTAAATPPAIATPPASRSVYERGVVSFSVSATGSPPLTYQWKKGGVDVPGATSSTLTIRPVTADSAGDYTCRVNNAANVPADSTAATLTVVPSMNTDALTECWQLPVGSRPWLTEGDTQRGLGYNPANGHVYVATRTPGVSVQVINAADGADVGALDMTDVTAQSGTAQYPLNMLGVAADGVIYACNLSNTGTGADFRIWQWPDDQAATVPAKVYDGNPAGVRTGDSFAVRGAGTATELIAGTTGPGFVLFKNDGNGFYTPYSITITDAAAESFQTGIAFGAGNTVWGKDAGRNVVLARYDVDELTGLPTGTGIRLATFSPPSTGGGAIAVDAVNGCLAHIHSADSDNVSLYRLPAFPLSDPAPAGLELLDQEFFQSDNTNLNGTGQAVIAGGKLFALNTNNGLACYTIAKPLPPEPDPEITDVTQAAGSVTFKLKGVMGRTYVIEKSTELTPLPTWTADGTVTQDEVEETITRPIPAGTPRLYYRAREQAPQ